MVNFILHLGVSFFYVFFIILLDFSVYTKYYTLSNQVPSFVGDILNNALEQLNQGQGAGLVSPMINKALESYSKDNSLTPDMNELFKLTSNNGISDIAGNIINTFMKK